MELALAYMRRKRWEAKVQAGEIVGLLGQALGGSKKRDQMSLAALSMMGFRVENAN